MPIVRTSSELQRNFVEFSSLCRETREPVYVTRNGEASLVVMDAQAYDEQTSRQDELERELAVYKALMQSEIDRLSGRGSDWEDVLRERESLTALAA